VDFQARTKKLILFQIANEVILRSPLSITDGTGRERWLKQRHFKLPASSFPRGSDTARKYKQSGNPRLRGPDQRQESSLFLLFSEGSFTASFSEGMN
jgi:hypothetical protein